MKEIGINLLKTQQALTPYELASLHRVKMLSVTSLVALLTVGTIVGSAFFIATQRINALENERLSVMRKLTLAARKEVMLLSLKERIPVTRRTMESQHDWNTIINAIKSVAVPPLLVGFEIDAKNSLVVDIEATNLDEIYAAALKINQLVVSSVIKKPVIKELVQSEDGLVRASFEFEPDPTYE
jgi:hypothetical protein